VCREVEGEHARVATGSREQLIDALLDPAGRADYVLPARIAVRRLAAARGALDALELELVRRARLDGATWREAASDLGVAPTTLRSRLERGSRPRPRFEGARQEE
jgi:DNA-directed RNA polymerase specialized sigma24 family protein